MSFYGEERVLQKRHFRCNPLTSIVCERAIDLGKDAYICFIDYTKAFDRVKHSKIIECLSEIGIDDKDLQIITKMYWEQTAVVRTEHGITKVFQIKKGVRQGYVLSPSVFNLYTEKNIQRNRRYGRWMLGDIISTVGGMLMTHHY